MNLQEKIYDTQIKGGEKMEEEKKENETAEAQLCICPELKVVMIGVMSKQVLPTYLYYQLEYIFETEYSIKDFMDYTIKLLDLDTTMSNLKEGIWR